MSPEPRSADSCVRAASTNGPNLHPRLLGDPDLAVGVALLRAYRGLTLSLHEGQYVGLATAGLLLRPLVGVL